MKRTILLLMLGASAAGCSTTATTGELGPAELRSAFAGKSVAFETPQGIRGTTHYSRAGTMRLSDSTIPGIPVDQGTWRTEGNRICHSWQRVRGGAEDCSTITRTGTGTYVNSSGVMLRTL
jgi:hypothetical protein